MFESKTDSPYMQEGQPFCSEIDWLLWQTIGLVQGTPETDYDSIVCKRALKDMNCSR